MPKTVANFMEVAEHLAIIEEWRDKVATLEAERDKLLAERDNVAESARMAEERVARLVETNSHLRVTVAVLSHPKGCLCMLCDLIREPRVNHEGGRG